MQVPRFLSQQQVRPAAGPRRSGINPELKALHGLGDVMQERALQRKQEQDTADVTTAFTKFRDESAEKLAELRGRKGADARGAGEEYKKWADEKLKIYHKDHLHNQPQIDKFNQLYSSHRAYRVDSLVSHETREHQAYKVQTQEALLENTKAELLLDPFNAGQVEAAIDRYHATIVDLFPGQNMDAHADKAEAIFRTNVLAAQIDQNPSAARPYLEEYKEEIGINNYRKFKNQIEAKEDEGRLNGAYTALNAKFPNDPEAAIEYLESDKNFNELGIDVTHQQKLILVYEAEQARNEEREQKIIDEGKEKDMNQVAELLRQDDVAGAMAAIDRSEHLTAQEKFKLETNLTKPKKNETNMVLRSQLIKDIQGNKVRHPWQIEQYNGYGLQPNDVSFLKSVLETYTKDPDQKFYTGLANDYFDLAFKDTDFAIFKPEFEAELHRQILGQNKEKKPLRGQEILDFAKNYAGSSKDIKDPWFFQSRGTEGEFLESGFGEDIKAMERRREEEKAAEGQPQVQRMKIGPQGQALPTDYKSIPDPDRAKIQQYLKDRDMALIESNFVTVYQHWLTTGKAKRETE